jgi:hypothetical protein
MRLRLRRDVYRYLKPVDFEELLPLVEEIAGSAA